MNFEPALFFFLETSSSQWYSWGPAHMQCRLCQSCWIYWKKFGGLKYPTRMSKKFFIDKKLYINFSLFSCFYKMMLIKVLYHIALMMPKVLNIHVANVIKFLIDKVCFKFFFTIHKLINLLIY